jgi:hypothetical protein
VKKEQAALFKKNNKYKLIKKLLENKLNFNGNHDQFLFILVKKNETKS